MDPMRVTRDSALTEAFQTDRHAQNRREESWELLFGPSTVVEEYAWSQASAEATYPCGALGRRVEVLYELVASWSTRFARVPSAQSCLQTRVSGRSRALHWKPDDVHSTPTRCCSLGNVPRYRLLSLISNPSTWARRTPGIRFKLAATFLPASFFGYFQYVQQFW